MAHNAPRGARSEPALRYPAPRWTPVNGWKVDPALAYAHTLQESNFRAKVVSPAGARGLMQIMPAAAIDHRGKLGIRGNARDLSKPEINLAFGQEHLNMLRNSNATQGKLPKIMAAYNAGLSPVTRWNHEIRDQNDALLYMESIPYWETRGYVAIVMRNYWMYERQAGSNSPSRSALAQGQWPAFPELTGGAVRRCGNCQLAPTFTRFQFDRVLVMFRMWNMQGSEQPKRYRDAAHNRRRCRNALALPNARLTETGAMRWKLWTALP